MIQIILSGLFIWAIIIVSMTVFHTGEEYSKIVVKNGFVSIIASRYNTERQKYVDTVRATIPRERFRFREHTYQPSKCWVDDDVARSGYTIQMPCNELVKLLEKETSHD